MVHHARNVHIEMSPVTFIKIVWFVDNLKPLNNFLCGIPDIAFVVVVTFF